MRIVLFATNRHHRLMSRMEARPLPIWLAYMAGHLDQSRHTLKVLDLMFSGEDYLTEVEETVRTFRPDLVGISIRNLSNHSYLDPQWALPIAKEVIQRIRATTQAPVVCGGPAFSIPPQECFSLVEPDLGLAGDAGKPLQSCRTGWKLENPRTSICRGRPDFLKPCGGASRHHKSSWVPGCIDGPKVTKTPGHVAHLPQHKMGTLYVLLSVLPLVHFWHNIQRLGRPKIEFGIQFAAEPGRWGSRCAD